MSLRYWIGKMILFQHRQEPSGHSLIEINICTRIMFPLISIYTHKTWERHNKSLRKHPQEENQTFCVTALCHVVTSDLTCLSYHFIYSNQKLLLGLSFLSWHHRSFRASLYENKANGKILMSLSDEAKPHERPWLWCSFRLDRSKREDVLGCTCHSFWNGCPPQTSPIYKRRTYKVLGGVSF